MAVLVLMHMTSEFNTAAREAQISYEDRERPLMINMAFAIT
jgi:hypothetical protein